MGQGQGPQPQLCLLGLPTPPAAAPAPRCSCSQCCPDYPPHPDAAPWRAPCGARGGGARLGGTPIWSSRDRLLLCFGCSDIPQAVPGPWQTSLSHGPCLCGTGQTQPRSPHCSSFPHPHARQAMGHPTALWTSTLGPSRPLIPTITLSQEQAAKLETAHQRASAQLLLGDSPPRGPELLGQAFSDTISNVTHICPAATLLPSWSQAFPPAPSRPSAGCPSPWLSQAAGSLLHSHSAAEFIRESRDLLPSFMTTYALL